MKTVKQNKLLHALQKSAPFKYLDAEEIAAILPFCEYLEFPPQHTIMTQGRAGRGIYVLLTGTASIKVNMLGKGQITLAKVKPGHFFGEVVLIDKGSCSATVTTDAACDCFFLSTLCYDAFLIGMPQIRSKMNRAIIEGVLQRQREISASLIELMSGLKQRPARTLPSLKAQLEDKKTHCEQITVCRRSKKDFMYLKELPMFHHFSHKEFETLLNYARCVKTQWHTELIHQHKKNHHCYFILEGSAQISIRSLKNHYKMAVTGPNTMLFSTAFFKDETDLFQVKTNDPTTLLEVPLSFFQKLEQSVWAKYFDIYCQSVVALQTPLNHLIMRLTNEKLESVSRR